MTIPATSQEALSSLEPHLGRLENQVLASIFDGHTCEELEELTGLSHQTCSARVRGLAKRELIVDSGMRRKTRSGRNAVVWAKWRLTA